MIKIYYKGKLKEQFKKYEIQNIYHCELVLKKFIKNFKITDKKNEGLVDSLILAEAREQGLTLKGY